MRIVFFSHYYPPEVNAPASRTSEHARVWARAGHDVVVVTCAPNHPGGRLYPGYANLPRQSETIDGVRVVRVWTYLAANEGFARRTLNYISYAASATLGMVGLDRPDVVVSTSPQFFCGLTGLVAKTIWRRPWVLEIRDLWPESIVTVGAMRKGLIVRLLERIEALAYRRADRIVSVTDSFVAHIAERGGTREKIAVIKNGANLELFTQAGDEEDCKRRYGLAGRFVAAYVGTHGMAHGLDTVLEAAKLLSDDPRIVLLLVGDGAERERLEQRKREMGLGNVIMLGQQPKDAMPGIWAATDVSMILLRRSDLFKIGPSVQDVRGDGDGPPDSPRRRRRGAGPARRGRRRDWHNPAERGGTRGRGEETRRRSRIRRATRRFGLHICARKLRSIQTRDAISRLARGNNRDGGRDKKP